MLHCLIAMDLPAFLSSSFHSIFRALGSRSRRQPFRYLCLVLVVSLITGHWNGIAAVQRFILPVCLVWFLPIFSRYPVGEIDKMYNNIYVLNNFTQLLHRIENFAGFLLEYFCTQNYPQKIKFYVIVISNAYWCTCIGKRKSGTDRNGATSTPTHPHRQLWNFNVNKIFR